LRASYSKTHPLTCQASNLHEMTPLKTLSYNNLIVSERPSEPPPGAYQATANIDAK